MTMTLYREHPLGAFSLWDPGQPIDGVLYSPGIAWVWGEDALAALGLYAPAAADAVPDGKIVTGTTVDRVSGVVRFVHTLEDAPVYVPQSITMRQARLALLAADLLADVEAIMAQPGREAARIEWEYATEMRRDHELITSLASELGLSADDIDALFIVASNI